MFARPCNRHIFAIFPLPQATNFAKLCGQLQRPSCVDGCTWRETLIRFSAFQNYVRKRSKNCAFESPPPNSCCFGNFVSICRDGILACRLWCHGSQRSGRRIEFGNRIHNAFGHRLVVATDSGLTASRFGGLSQMRPRPFHPYIGGRPVDGHRRRSDRADFFPSGNCVNGFVCRTTKRTRRVEPTTLSTRIAQPAIRRCTASRRGTPRSLDGQNGDEIASTGIVRPRTL